MKEILTKEFTFLKHEEHGGITVLKGNEPYANHTESEEVHALLNRIEDLEEKVARIGNEVITTEDRVMIYASKHNKDLFDKWRLKSYNDNDHNLYNMVTEILYGIDLDKIEDGSVNI